MEIIMAPKINVWAKDEYEKKVKIKNVQVGRCDWFREVERFEVAVPMEDNGQYFIHVGNKIKDNQS